MFDAASPGTAAFILFGSGFVLGWCLCAQILIRMRKKWTMKHNS